MRPVIAMAQATLPLSARTTPTVDIGAWGLRASALIYLGVLILTPLVVITIQGLRGGLEELWTSVTRPAALEAVWLSVSTAGIMALINAVMGTLTAIPA